MSNENIEKNEILEFLEEINATAEPTETKSSLDQLEIKAELTEEEYRILKDSEEETQRERLQDVPEIPVSNEFDSRPYDDLFTAMVADLGKIEVSDYEKDMFIKSILNDSPFYTISKILGGKVLIKVKSRNIYNDNLIFKSLTKDEAEKYFVGVEGMMQRMQAYIAAAQVVEINGKDYNLEISNENTFEENYENLQVHLRKYDSMQTQMWAAIVLAVRIHEYKTKICMDNLNNENFWESAGINT
jgi:hypothetical protein